MTLGPRTLAWALLLPPFTSCSLMGLDDFDAGRCRSDLDCARAEQRLAEDPARCGKYACREGVCVWADGSERCNGGDDDCDGWIDEDVAIEPESRSGSIAAPASVAWATDPTASRTYVVTGGDSARGFVLDDLGSLESEAALRYESALPPSEPGRCPSDTGLLTPSGGQCNFSEVAVAADARHLVFASINTRGCAAGQMRIGISEHADPYSVWLGKSAVARALEPSNIALGVDVGEQRCTGASRTAAASSPAAPIGATRPAVASIDTSPGAEGALALWLAAESSPEGAADCDAGASVAVEALGVFVPEGEPKPWLDGSAGGRPLEIGRTTRRAAPAVVPLSRPGEAARYAVAFAAEVGGERGLRLFLVRAAPAALTVEPFAFIPDSGVDRAALAVIRPEGEPAKIGVAWSAGCGVERRFNFATLPLAPRPRVSEIVTIEAPSLVFRPQLVHAPRGFSTNPPGGGWFLLWAQGALEDARELKLARVTDGAPSLLNLLTLRSGAVGYPVSYPSADTSVGYALLGGGLDQPSQLESGVGFCGDRG